MAEASCVFALFVLAAFPLQINILFRWYLMLYFSQGSNVAHATPHIGSKSWQMDRRTDVYSSADSWIDQPSKDRQVFR